MSGKYDDVLKTLVNARQEDFARWVLPLIGGQEVRVVKPLKTEFHRHLLADDIWQVIVDDADVVFHYEFQTTSDKEMPERGLEYQFQSLREHHLPIWTFLIYLKKDGPLPTPPWYSPPVGGRSSITFDYTVIDLSSMTAEELRKTGLSGILPLMILTRDGATREVAEEIMIGLEPLGDDEVGIVAYTLIALTLKHKGDHEWLSKRWKSMSDKLKDNWFIQEITEDARKETEKRVREEERRKLEEEQRKREEEQRKREEEQRKREEERRQEIERWRQTVVGLVEARFKNQKVSRIAKGQAALINDPQQLQGLLLKVGLASTAEEAEDYLLSWPESA
jgi:predicted transposase YdaD